MRTESPGPQREWLDGDAGPVVRPYTLTGGRVRSAADGFDLVAVHEPPAGSDIPNDDILKAVVSGLRAL
ncbi:hypothetical protein ACLQ24_24605 [Micromonospora sp. DT4]|uniref:hypothetical protein n=1 Tax=Micromonospora sp. DT4 TaxID=3393438 RepID=UPI003CF074CB